MPIKMLLVGNSGAGKTSRLAALAANGYKVKIADFDNGTEVLDDPSILAPQFRQNLSVKTFYDKIQIVNGTLVPTASAASDFISAMGKWPDDKEGHKGNIFSWGEESVFVIDSLSFLSNACLSQVLFLAGRLTAGVTISTGQGGVKFVSRPQQADIGGAQDMIESIIETIYNPAVRCHVIVTAHLIPQADETANNITKLFPLSVGKKLNPKIARYFNNAILVEKVGFGKEIKIQFQTAGTHNVDLKNTRPSIVPATMPGDLATLFNMLKKGEPTEAPMAPQPIPLLKTATTKPVNT